MSHHLDDSKYSVHNRKEIVSILDGLRKVRTTIQISFSHEEKFNTYVIEVSDESNHVHLDASADERVNSRIADSKHLSFATRSGVQVKWHSTHASLVELPDGTALSILVPSVMQRIQRRECFRLPLPQGKKGLICRIPLPEETLEAPIKDMSAGGVCLALKEPLHPVFSQGVILEGCLIEFPAVGVVQFKLRMCGTRPTSETRSKDNVCIGMEFMDLSTGADNVVQRYLLQLESENRAQFL